MKQTEDKDIKKRESIDWDAAYLRSETTATALEQGGVPNPKEKKKILKARAKVLAQETQETGILEESLELIEFMLASERYGIEASYVREVYPLRELVPIPGTPPFILGITNLRGKIVSVTDIKKLFDLPEKGLTELDKIIVVQANGMEMGIHADVVIAMRTVALEEIQPPPPTLTGIRERYLKGITKEQVTILDMEKVFSDKNIIVHEEVEI